MAQSIRPLACNKAVSFRLFPKTVNLQKRHRCTCTCTCIYIHVGHVTALLY